ncbi:hypothetical protein I4F81_009387 [Pyropia yezoensis]|uniref:Uncharacterized protein n=1 Tax=Pyropia yezoensis TaxID=2788 RepID=A0ACC3C9S8_PYRYE|nr:hypothetical protein I4F81_009387 [Neopyropia yezoensis]
MKARLTWRRLPDAASRSTGRTTTANCATAVTTPHVAPVPHKRVPRHNVASVATALATLIGNNPHRPSPALAVTPFPSSVVTAAHGTAPGAGAGASSATDADVPSAADAAAPSAAAAATLLCRCRNRCRRCHCCRIVSIKRRHRPPPLPPPLVATATAMASATAAAAAAVPPPRWPPPRRCTRDPPAPHEGTGKTPAAAYRRPLVHQRWH